MEKGRSVVSIIVILVMVLTVSFGTGCATKGQTGALTGAGAGALIGGLANMHGSWGATALLGAGIGAGVGYLIGNEEDKKDAERRRAVREDELRPLAGTTWQVVSIVPEPRESVRSIVSHFRHDGTVVTTKTNMDGRVEKTTERYRIVGSTLIFNKPGYVENTRFRIDRDRLIIDYGNGSAVLQRVS
ncbi:MAG: glycine zipper domain-containing protein [Nitrospirae bacterium]|nr:glycine zipper domain-containing protein [Nitrospirota bacterium]